MKYFGLIYGNSACEICMCEVWQITGLIL